MTRTGARWLLLLVTTALAVAVVLAALEIHLRRGAAQVVARRNSAAQGMTELLDSEQLVQTTPNGGRRFIPNIKAIHRNHPFTHRDIPIEINALGFRSPPLPAKKAPGSFRILVLGDSVTMGEGVDESQTYVRRLEADLRARSPGANIDVINGGIGDTGTREQVEVFRERGLALDPDVVVVGFYLNDSRPPWGFAGELGTRGWLRRHSVLADVLYRDLAVRRWVRDRGGDRFEWVTLRNTVDWAHDEHAFRQLVSAARYDWGSAWDADSWVQLRRTFGDLKALAGNRTIVLAVLPVSYQVDARFNDDVPQVQAKALASDLGFAFIDFLPMLRQHAADTRLFYDQCHLTPDGHALVGRTLADFLEQRGLVQASPGPHG